MDWSSTLAQDSLQKGCSALRRRVCKDSLDLIQWLCKLSILVQVFNSL